MLTFLLTVLVHVVPAHAQGLKPFTWRNNFVGNLPQLARLVADAADRGEIDEMRAAARARGNPADLFARLPEYVDDPALQTLVYERVGQPHPLFGPPSVMRELSKGARDLLREVESYGFAVDDLELLREVVSYSSDEALRLLYEVELAGLDPARLSLRGWEQLIIVSQVKCEAALERKRSDEARAIRQRRFEKNLKLYAAALRLRDFNFYTKSAFDHVRRQMVDLARTRVMRLSGEDPYSPVTRIDSSVFRFDQDDFVNVRLAEMRAAGVPERVIERVERWMLRKQVAYFRGLLRAADAGLRRARGLFAGTAQAWDQDWRTRFGLRDKWPHVFEEAKYRDLDWEAQIRYELLRAEDRIERLLGKRPSPRD